jgi:hypothetical protein
VRISGLHLFEGSGKNPLFFMLAEAGYLSDTQNLLLQNVFVDPQLAAYLLDRGESYVLRCLEVAE